MTEAKETAQPGEKMRELTPPSYFLNSLNELVDKAGKLPGNLKTKTMLMHLISARAFAESFVFTDQAVRQAKAAASSASPDPSSPKAE